MDKVSIQPPIHSKYIFRICLGFTVMGTALYLFSWLSLWLFLFVLVS